MSRTLRNLLCFLVACAVTAPVMAAKEVVLTRDPTANKPTFVSDTSYKKIDYVSINFTDKDNPESFSLVFDSGFTRQYDTDTSKYTEGKVQADGTIVFESKSTHPNGNDCKHTPSGSGSTTFDCQVVAIRVLNKSTSSSPGYQYTVKMGADEIDPRLRGK